MRNDWLTSDSFFRYYTWLKRPTEIINNSNIYMFKDEVEPMWEVKSSTEFWFNTCCWDGIYNLCDLPSPQKYQFW